jgi:hypothetical protein
LFGPAKPEGVADSNWLQIVKGREFLACIRICGADLEFFDQMWKPEDVVKIN